MGRKRSLEVGKGKRDGVEACNAEFREAMLVPDKADPFFSLLFDTQTPWLTAAPGARGLEQRAEWAKWCRLI